MDEPRVPAAPDCMSGRWPFGSAGGGHRHPLVLRFGGGGADVVVKGGLRSAGWSGRIGADAGWHVTLVVKTVVVAEAGVQIRGAGDNVPEPLRSRVESGSGTVDGAMTDRLTVLRRLVLGGATVIEGIGLAATSAAEGFVEGDRQLQGLLMVRWTVMSRVTLSAICALVMLAPLAGCGWVGGRHGTGEPEWRFSETYIDYPNEARFITLDEGGVARVGDIPNRDAKCAESSEKNISGEGVWAATGYGAIQIKVADRVIQIRSGTYRGVLDWGRIDVAFCANDFAGPSREFYHTGYAMDY